MPDSTAKSSVVQRPAVRRFASRHDAHPCRRPLHRAAQAAAAAGTALALATPGARWGVVVAVLVALAARMVRFGLNPLAGRGAATRVRARRSAAATVSDAALVFALAPLLACSVGVQGALAPVSAAVWAMVVYSLRAAAHRFATAAA
jgi:hypothetical protein